VVALFGAAHAQRRLLGITLREELLVDHEERLAAARAELDETGFDVAWRRGEAMSVQEAGALALALAPLLPG
jgi:hypothetical protein